MDGEPGEVVGDAGDRRRVARAPLGRERFGLRACDRDGLVAGLGITNVKDGPAVGADLVVIVGGDLGEYVAGAVKP